MEEFTLDKLIEYVANREEPEMNYILYYLSNYANIEQILKNWGGEQDSAFAGEYLSKVFDVVYPKPDARIIHPGFRPNSPELVSPTDNKGYDITKDIQKWVNDDTEE